MIIDVVELDDMSIGELLTVVGTLHAAAAIFVDWEALAGGDPKAVKAEGHALMAIAREVNRSIPVMIVSGAVVGNRGGLRIAVADAAEQKLRDLRGHTVTLGNARRTAEEIADLFEAGLRGAG